MKTKEQITKELEDAIFVWETCYFEWETCYLDVMDAMANALDYVQSSQDKRAEITEEFSEHDKERKE